MIPPPCTCRAVQVPSRGPGPKFVVEHCKLHAAATKLLKACKAALNTNGVILTMKVGTQIERAIDEAEGRT